jgi:uncharacterized membrane protein
LVALVAIGLSLVLLAVLPAARKPVPLLIVAGLLFAILVGFEAFDSFLVAAAGLLPLLVGLVLREVVDTFRLLSAPRLADRREQRVERRALERTREHRQREYERRAKDRLAA